MLVAAVDRDLAALGFDGGIPEKTGRPSYHPATILKIYIYGYLNQVQSSRGLERECRRIQQRWSDSTGMSAKSR